jgi:hypothetical protein
MSFHSPPRLRQWPVRTKSAEISTVAEDEMAPSTPGRVPSERQQLVVDENLDFAIVVSEDGVVLEMSSLRRGTGTVLWRRSGRKARIWFAKRRRCPPIALPAR